MRGGWCMSCLVAQPGCRAAHLDSKKKGISVTTTAGMIGGIDSHKDTIHVAVITQLGVDVSDHEFTTTQAGYREATDWLRAQDCLHVLGVEGTSSYGLGVTTALREAGAQVIEVNRTRPAERRRQGKSDRLDAYRAARAVLSGEASTIAKSDTIEPLRAVHNARKSAVKAQRVRGNRSPRP